MLLILDIGNTNITVGMYRAEKLVKVENIPSDTTLPFETYYKLFYKMVEGYDISDCMICSVVDEITNLIKDVVDKVCNTDSKILTYKSYSQIKLKTDRPETIGADRIANVLYTYKHNLFPAIIVDIGTATTFDVINKNGEFIGGVIMPGLNLQLKALNLYTSKLPYISLKNSEEAIGYDTETCILSGVVRGHSCAIEGLYEQCIKELGYDVKFIGTGGNAPLVAEYMSKKFDITDANLTLEGIRFAYENL